MSKKKSIFAVGLFVLLGLFIYSFARPNSEKQLEEEKGSKTEQKETKNNDEDPEETTEEDGQEEDINESTGTRDTRPSRSSTRTSARTQSVIPINYESLQQAITDGELINIETDNKELQNLLEELEGEILQGNEILTNGAENQGEVDSQTNAINDALSRVNNFIDQELEDSVDSGEKILFDDNINQLTNPNLGGMLTSLGVKVSGEELLSKTEPQQKLDHANEIRRLVTSVNQLLGELDIIDNASISLISSNEEWTNENITLTLKIEIDDENLIESYSIFDVNDESNKTDTKTLEVSQNGTYQGQVIFTNGETRSTDEYEVKNIERNAPTYEVIGNPTDWTNEIGRASCRERV